MRVEYVIITFIIFMVLLVVAISFAKDILPGFSQAIDSFLKVIE